MRKWKLWGALALVVVVGIIVFQNTESVETQVLWMQIEMPRFMLLGMTLLTGVLIGILFSGWARRRADRKHAASTAEPPVEPQTVSQPPPPPPATNDST